MWSTRHSTGCPGTTSTAFSNRSDTFLQSSSSRCTIATKQLQSPWPESTKTVSGKPGAVHSARGLKADHTTIWRWVQRYGPELKERLRRHRKPTNKSWRVDETYVRVKGRWCYLYRAIALLLFLKITTHPIGRVFTPARRVRPVATGRRKQPENRHEDLS